MQLPPSCLRGTTSWSPSSPRSAGSCSATTRGSSGAHWRLALRARDDRPGRGACSCRSDYRRWYLPRSRAAGRRWYGGDIPGVARGSGG